MILVVTECLLGGCLHVVCFCYCCLYVLNLLGKFSSVFRLYGSVVWYLIVLPVQWVFWLWLFCGVNFMYIIYSRQAHSITRLIIFQLEFNYIAQGDVNNKGTQFMFILKNSRLTCPITAKFEDFAAVMIKILECWTIYS